MKMWKRNAVIAGVLVLVCAGIYLNWLYGSKTPELTATLDADKIMGETTLVLSNQNQEPAAEVSGVPSGEEYFAKMRLSRQTARDEAVELLQEAIAYAEGADTSQTNQKLEAIISDSLAESKIESMAIAKGYEDCVAYISDGTVSVAVAAPKDGLLEKDVALLADIVMAQTDYNLSQIRVFGVE